MAAPILGAHTLGFVWQSDAETAFERVAELGITSVQLMATPPHFDPWVEDRARTVRLASVLRRTGMNLLALDLASSDINLASASQVVVNFAVDAYERTIERCAELGAPWICVGSGRRHALLSAANDRLMDTYKAAFARIYETAQRRGITVLLENHPQGLLARADATERFLREGGYDNVLTIYDVANAAAVGEDPAAGLAEIMHRVRIVHLSDAPEGQWRHDPIGSGDIDFEAIRRVLAERSYGGHVVLEIMAPDAATGLDEGIASLRIGGWIFA